MIHLHQHIAVRVDKWRNDNYSCDDYPAIAEVLEWAKEAETGNLRFLRRPQLRALETYWYLRLIEKTPHIFDHYKKLFPTEEDIAALLEALGVSDAAFKAANYKEDRLFDRIKADDAFVKKKKTSNSNPFVKQ